MVADVSGIFEFVREYVRLGTHQAPQQVKLNGKFYNFRSAERVGDCMVYTCTFDNREPILFKFTLAELSELDMRKHFKED